ncbi:cytochrome c oxidase assembly factor 3 homolog, mitochondrial [Hypomesus transpacificus]|uniref:cytochrome c oxidase assembly factor 3 homolog, mitochondrial n=1 Tax=Hypomesus transpacificus TaxID=137520 RepID=UPI001F084A10|nr:cytochrome c oxidase assembly factor 3 homolog, mitochondrial [Hypomesus transpacificus]
MGSIMVFRSYNSRTHGVCNKPDIATDTASMADKTPKEQSEAAFAKRIDPTKEDLSNEQTYFIRQVELAQWKKKTSHLRGRNVATGLAIGAMVMGIYGYTFYSVSQEKIMDELDAEAKVARLRGPKTGAN